MGVKGLTTFVKDHQQVLLEDYQLHSTKLVIDGFGLMYMFYNHNVDPGNRGEFQKFYAKSATFFHNLKSCGIEPFVVLDGGYDVDGKKIKTQWKTSQGKLDRLKLINEGSKHVTLLPPMTSEVYKRVMQDFGIHFVFVSFEADKDVAVLANQLQCPVLGSDSDFYIMNIHQGYIPLDMLKWGKLQKMPKSMSWGYDFFLNCRRYKIGKFCKIFHIQPCLMPLFASLCGNDYLEPWSSNLDKVIASLDASAGLSSGNLTFIQPSRQSNQRQLIEKLLNLLSHFSTHGECFHEIIRQTNTEEKAKVRHNFLMSCGMYDVTKPTTVIDFFLGWDKQLLKHPLVKEFSLPVHFVKLFEVGSVPKMALNILLSQIHFFRPQIENLSELPSINCCMCLIRIISGIMLQGIVDVCNNEKQTTETLKVDIPCREGHTLQSNYVDPVYQIPNYGKVPSFKEIPGISKQQRLALLTASLNVKDVHLGNAPKSFSLALLITIYWFRNANPSVSQHHLCSLMLGWVQGVAWLQNNKKHIPRHNFEGLELEYYWDDNEIGCILQNFEPFCRQNPSSGNTPDLDDSHAFAQWLDCVRMTRYLNQLLLEVYPPPEMTVLFNGVLVHNICFELKTTKPVAYKEWIEENLLVGGPNAHKLFSALKIFFGRHLELHWQW